MGFMGCVTVREASIRRDPERTVVVVRLEARTGRATLVLDSAWVDLALDARSIDPELLEGLHVPPEAIVAFYDDWV